MSSQKDGLLTVNTAGNYEETASELSSDNYADEEMLIGVASSTSSSGQLLRERFLQYFALMLWVGLLTPILLKIFGVGLPVFFGISLASWSSYGIVAVMLHVLARIVVGLWVGWLKNSDDLGGSDLPSYLEAVLLPLSTFLSTIFFALLWYSINPIGCPSAPEAPPNISTDADPTLMDIPITNEASAAASIIINGLGKGGTGKSLYSAITFMLSGDICIYEVVGKVMLCFAICSVTFLLEMLLLRLGLWRFLRSHFQERILDSRYKCYVVEGLRCRVASNLMQFSMAEAKAQSKLTISFPFSFPFRVPLLDNFVDWLNGMMMRGDIAGQGGNTSAPSQRPMAYIEYRRRCLDAIQRQGLNLVAVSSSMPQSDGEVKGMGKDLFARICPADRKYLVPGDFQPIFLGQAATRDAYYIFDRDQDGTISKTEFVQTVISVLREQRNLATSVEDASQAFNKLANTVHGVLIGGLVFFCLGIFGIHVQALFAVLLSLVLGLNVVIGDAAKKSIQGIIFLFIDHPYDVGDRVIVGALNEPDPLLVHQINMLTTVFHRWNGQEIYAPNALLAGSTIYNVSRSSEQWERIDFQVLAGEPQGPLEGQSSEATLKPSIDRLGHFRDKLESFIKSRPGDFLQNPEFKPMISGDYGKAEDSLETISMTLRIQCKPTADPQKRWARHSRLLSFVRKTLQSIGLELQGKLKPTLH